MGLYNASTSEDIIKTKSVSILKDDSKMMNENFPVAKKLVRE